MVPYNRQTAQTPAQGLRLTQAGPDLIKATAYRIAEVARLWDPQVAALRYRQMMEVGKHHLQAVCARATNLPNGVYAILQDQRPHELRNMDGTPVCKKEARRICPTDYHVRDEVRKRRNHRNRDRR